MGWDEPNRLSAEARIMVTGGGESENRKLTFGPPTATSCSKNNNENLLSAARHTRRVQPFIFLTKNTWVLYGVFIQRAL